VAEPQQRAPWPGDLQAGQRAARPRHPPHLPQRRADIGHVAQHKAGGDRVEGFVRERQPQRVAADECRPRAEAVQLPLASLHHRYGIIDTDGQSLARPGSQLRHEVAGAAADIQRAAAGRGRDRADRRRAPAAIHAKGHQAVHPVVARRDAGEHLLDVGRFCFRRWQD
jgi:hypothetical protein